MLELEEGPSPADMPFATETLPIATVEVDRQFHRAAWCFVCRKVTIHCQVLTAKIEPTYWGPKITVACDECGTQDADIFPGQERTYG